MAAKISGEIKVIYSGQDNVSPVNRGIQSSLKKTEATSRSVSEKIQKQWRSVSRVFKIATAALAAGAGATALIMKKAVEAANQQDIAEKKLAASIGYTSKALLQQASALQKVTAYGDEEIIKAQALIGIFVKNEDQIKKLTQATLDLATAQGMKLEDAAKLVAKSIGSSTNALSRYGIVVEGAVGSTERVNSLVQNVAATMGGQAVAAAETYAGKLTQVKNVLGDMFEKLGYVITHNKFMVQVLEYVKRGILNVSDAIKENQFALMNYTKTGVIRFLNGVKYILIAVKWIRSGFYGLSVVVTAVFAGITEVLYRFAIILKNTVLLPISAVLDVLVKMGKLQENPIKKAIEGLDKVRTAAKQTVGNLIDNWDKGNEKLNQTIKNIENITGQIKKIPVEMVKETRKAGTQIPKIVEEAGEKTKNVVEEKVNEIDRIYSWMNKRWMELTLTEKQIKKQQLTEEYNRKAAILLLHGDMIGYLKLQIMYQMELAKLNEGEKEKLTIETQKADIYRQQNDFLKEQLYLKQQISNFRESMYSDIWSSMMEGVNLIGGQTGEFLGMAMSGVKGQMDIIAGYDPYSARLQQLQQFYAQEIQLLISKNATQREIIETELQYEAQMTEMYNAQKYSSYANYTNMIMGVLGTLVSFTGKNTKAMFLIEKAAAIANIIIRAQEAAALAIATIPPPLGEAIAAKRLAMGYTMAAIAAATTIMQFAGRSKPAGTAPSAGGYTYTQPEQPQWQPTETKQSKTINVYIYGNVVDHDAFAREIIPSLEKAVGDNVH